MYQYPYGNAQQLNLDWILGKIQELETDSGGGSDLEEIANVLVSASYDTGVSYRRYDYCFYNGKLYRALNDTTGAFNPSDWLEITLGADIPVLTRLLNAVDASLTSLQNTVNDLDSDDIDNASTVTGTSVSDALETLQTNLSNEITSRQNDDLVIEKLTAASFENGSTSSRLYNVGDYIIRNGGLYKVIQTIAQGAAFVIDTNLESTTVGVQLTYSQTPHFFTGIANIFATAENSVITSVEAARSGCIDSIYLVLNGNITNGMQIGTLKPVFRPYTSWALLSLYALQDGAYLPIGCVWINSAGVTTVYVDTSISLLPAAIYCYGTYTAYKDNS